MNTIKIYFDTDGSIKELRKDFQLYQGQFHDKLLNVYVPTSVLAPDFTVENEQGQTIADFVASTSVKVGMKYIARNGSIKKSKNYYMNYLKVMTQNGVEYAVYERKLPKEFTTYAGQGENAPQLVVNVVNLDIESDPAEVLSVITTQECALEVMPSADLDNDEAVEPSEWELMNAKMNAVEETLLEKQDKTDPLLQTDAKTVVGAINENKGHIDTNTTNISSNSGQIAGLRNDIADLTARVESGENYIGQMEGENMPTSAQLNQFVEDTVARATAVGDVIIFVLDSDPKRNYKFTYYQSGWSGYELTTVSKADNNIYGLLKGTYGIDSANEVLLDINNGEVLHIWVQDGTTYRDLKEFLGANKTAIANILDGTTPVAEAIKAEQDGNGDNIANTYLTQTAGATKQYVQDYAVPKTFTNVYFISADGYVSEPPAVSETPAFSATTAGAGETEIIKDGDSSDLEMDLAASFDLSISNSYRNTFWVVASEDCNVQFRLVTQYKKPTEEWADLNIELSEEYPLVADNYERIDFSSQFLSLGSETVSLGLGDKIRQFLSVIVQVDTPITFGVFSNTVYPSTFNLVAQNYVPAGATSVFVNGSPVSTWNADTKADLANYNQQFITGSIEIGSSFLNSTTITRDDISTMIYSPNGNITILAGNNSNPNKYITLQSTGSILATNNLMFSTGKTAKVPTPTANEDAAPKSYVDNTTSIHTLWTGSVTSGEITLSENFSNYNILYFKLVNSNNEINTAVILSEDFNDTSNSSPFDITGKGETVDRYFNIYKSANDKMTIGSHLNMTLKSVKGGY